MIIKLNEGEGYVVSCNCRYFWSFNLYCSHIFSVMNLLQIRTLDKFEPYNRWTKKFHASMYRDQFAEYHIDEAEFEMPKRTPKQMTLGQRTWELLQNKSPK